jgi:hypothetical protein
MSTRISSSNNLNRWQLICGGIKVVEVLCNRGAFYHLQGEQLFHQVHFIICWWLLIHPRQGFH